MFSGYRWFCGVLVLTVSVPAVWSAEDGSRDSEVVAGRTVDFPASKRSIVQRGVAPTTKSTVATGQKTSPAGSGAIAATRGITEAPVNDDCANATPIAGLGAFPFNNIGATEDGPEHARCQVDYDTSGAIANDVWFCWDSDHTGAVQVSTCGGTTIDTKIAVYNGCTCPPTDGRLFPLGCDDDDLACVSDNDAQSTVVFLAQEGRSYLLRIGTYAGSPPASPGSGTFSISAWDALGEQYPAAPQCQVPYFYNGNGSDFANLIAADDFSPSDDGEIVNLCWWGGYHLDTPSDDAFEVRYYKDNNGLPGDLLAGPFIQEATTPTLLVDGPVNTGTGITFPIFEYCATHAAVPVVAGQCYWLEIVNNNGINLNAWYWWWGLGGDVSSLQDGTIGDPEATPPIPSTPPDGYDTDDVEVNDLAFCLGMAFDSCGTPPSDAADWSCCEPDSGSGRDYRPACGDDECCAKVCSCDPACCDPGYGWDEYCAGTGYNDSGCGAAVLCTNICGDCLDGSVTWVSPEDGTVDPGQPHPIFDATTPQGIATVLVDAPSGARDVCWSLCETDNTGMENDFARIIDHGVDAYTIQLDRPITPGALTRVTYTSDLPATYSDYLFALPGDADGSMVTDSSDIGHLVDCLNGAACTLREADINRSGSADSQDLLRLIDLLNGAHDYDVWSGATVPQNCP